jgi:hypothetical protein
VLAGTFKRLKEIWIFKCVYDGVYETVLELRKAMLAAKEIKCEGAKARSRF